MLEPPRNRVRFRFPATAAAERHRLAPIDGLRALSILGVICFHAIYFLGFFTSPQQYLGLAARRLLAPLLQGHFGVDVFFVISGYLIAAMLLREQQKLGTVRLGRFYLRRATRILPAYVVVLFLSPLVLRSYSNLDSAWANLLFVNNFLPVEKQALGWSWSLAIEEQFYLLFPIALLFTRARPDTHDPRCGARAALPWLFGLLMLGFAIRGALVLALRLEYPNPFHPTFNVSAFNRYFDAIYDKPYGRYGGILCGVIVAYLERAESALRAINRHLRAARLLVIACLLGLALFLTRPGFVPAGERGGPLVAALFTTTFRYVFALLIAYLLLYTLARSRAGSQSRLARLLSWRAFLPIAELSYGAYLLHPLVIIALWAKLQLASPSLGELAAVTLLALAITFTLALPLFLLVERPLRSWGRRLTA